MQMEKDKTKRIKEVIVFLEQQKIVMLEILKVLEEVEDFEQCATLYDEIHDITKEIIELERMEYIGNNYERKIQFH